MECLYLRGAGYTKIRYPFMRHEPSAHSIIRLSLRPHYGLSYTSNIHTLQEERHHIYFVNLHELKDSLSNHLVRLWSVIHDFVRISNVTFPSTCFTYYNSLFSSLPINLLKMLLRLVRSSTFSGAKLPFSNIPSNLLSSFST